MKGSFTIEAALVLTVILLILGWLMQQTVVLYKQVEETAIEREIDAIKPVEVFRQIQWLHQIRKQAEG